MEVDFKQEWYGIQSKIIEQTDDFIVIDYGCRGHGIITNYFLLMVYSFAFRFRYVRVYAISKI